MAYPSGEVKIEKKLEFVVGNQTFVRNTNYNLQCKALL
jgi:hypothetical protein